MPTIPTYGKCAELGCNNPKGYKSSFCDEHRPKRSKYYRPTPTHAVCEHDGMYNTRQWHTFRQIQLSSHPLCAGCLADGVVTTANHVDHVFPWTHIGKQAFTTNLFQSLCHACHSSKTSLEKRGIYRMYGTPSIDYCREDYTRVMYPPPATK